MIQVTSEFRAALFATDNQPVDLYELMLDSGTLRFSDQAINWNGNTYAAKITARSPIKRYDGGQFDGVRIQFANTDTTAAQTFLTQNVEGRQIVIRKVDRTVTNDSIVLFNGIMRRVGRIDENTVELEAEELLAAIDQDVSGRLFTPSCNWIFKGNRCGYSGAGLTCDRSWAKCNSYGNTHRFGGFRFFGQTGTYQYQDTETKRFLLLFRRKKKTTVNASFSSVDDTPYDVPIPIVLGRVQLAGVPMQHVDQGGITKVLAAMCVGPVEEMFYPRANQADAPDWTWHPGADGTPGGQDSRFPASYPYSRLAYVGVTIPSDVRTEDAAPTITAVVRGAIVDLFNAGGAYTGFAWSDNPVWLTRHLLSLPLEEGGGGVPSEWFDDAANYVEAEYCNQSIVDATNGSKIYYPTDLPTGTSYKAYRPTGVIGGNPSVDGPYGVYGVSDDDTSLAPVTLNVRRFTLNTVIAKQAKLSDVLYNKLFAAYRGFHTYSKEGKIQLRVERPTTSSPMVSAIAAGATTLTTNLPYFAVGDSILISPFTAQAEVRQVLTASAGTITFAATTYAHAAGAAIFKVAMGFDDTNMIGSAAYPLQDRQSSINRVVVKYVNPAAAFAEQTVHVNDYEHQAQIHRVNSVEVDGSAIDSFCQAYRIGQFQMRKFRELGKFVELRGNITAILLEIGDVIAVSAVECGLQAVPFRVIELGFEENDEVTILAQLYDAGAYDDTAPQTTVTVPAIFGAVEGSTGGGPGPEIPNDVTAMAGSWAFGPEAADGSRPAILTVTYTAPVAGEFAGVRATYQVGAGAIIPAGLYDPGPVTIEILAPNPAQSVKVTLASRTAEYEKPVDGTTPNVTIAGVGGTLEAQNVGSVTAVASYKGDQWGVGGVVTFGANRASIRYCELIIVGPYTAGGAVIAGYTIERPWTTFIPPSSGNYTYNVPPSWIRFGNDQQFEVVCKVYSSQNVETANPARSAKFTVSAVNQTTQATGVSVTVNYVDDYADGISAWSVTCGWTNANDLDFGLTRIFVEKQLSPGVWEARGLHIETGPGGVGAGFAQTGTGGIIDATPKVSTPYRFSFVTMTLDGQERPGAPQVTVNVTPQTGKLKATRIDPATLSTEFANFGGFIGITNLAGTKIQDNSIFTPKLSTLGLDIGGGGSKPARLRIFDNFGTLRAFVGLDPGFGVDSVAWFGSLRLGPNIYAPNVYVDTAGNMTIAGGTFTLERNSIRTSIQNLSDSLGFTGLIVQVIGGNQRTSVLAGVVSGINVNGQVGWYLSCLGGNGYLGVRDSFGIERSFIAGSNGSIVGTFISTMGGELNAGTGYLQFNVPPTFAGGTSGSAGSLAGYLNVKLAGGANYRIALLNP
jgi:hypothetical protein